MDLKEFLSRSSDTRHPWEVSRKNFFSRLLSGLVNGAGVEMLDVGSGDSWLARQLFKVLPANSQITCVDEFYTTESLEKMNTPGPIALTNAIAAGRKFDIILMLDVLEHVADEKKFLDGLLEHAKPETRIVISVPAFPELFGPHDVFLHHFRRYRYGQLRRVLEGMGLEILDRGGLFHSLVYARFGEKLIEKLCRKKPEATGIKDWTGGKLLTSFITVVLDFDWKLTMMLRKLILLPGLSWWCVCRKRS
jgi:hypothetical protein